LTLVELVGSIFEIRALGKPKDFLRIVISRDLAQGTIAISQESKALAVAKQLGVTGSQKALHKSPEAYAGLRAARSGEPMAEKLEYQQVVDSLLNLAHLCALTLHCPCPH
jgi:hypothetical protein